MENIGQILVRADRYDALVGLHVSFDAVDLHQTACRGRGRSQEERMVATRSGSQDRPRSKAAESVGLEPLRVRRDPSGRNC